MSRKTVTPALYESKNPKGFVVVYPKLENGRIVRGRKFYSPSKEKQARAHHAQNAARFPEVGAKGLAMNAEARDEFWLIKNLEDKGGVRAVDLLKKRIATRTSLYDDDLVALANEWLDKKRPSSEEATSKDRRLRLFRWIDDCRLEKPSDIDEDHTRTHIFSNGWQPVTIHQHASTIREFCRWLMKSKRCLDSNPMDFIGLPKIGPTNPKTLKKAEIERLLKASIPWPGMVSFYAIGFLAGLRPSEIDRLKEADFILRGPEPSIRVDKRKKGRGRRLVPISRTLMDWLNAYGMPRFSKKVFEKTRSMAKVEWQPDILRHTYGSCQMAITKNPNVVAYWMGNTERVIRESYLDLLTEHEAKNVMAISPNFLGLKQNS